MRVHEKVFLATLTALLPWDTKLVLRSFAGACSSTLTFHATRKFSKVENFVFKARFLFCLLNQARLTRMNKIYNNNVLVLRDFLSFSGFLPSTKSTFLNSNLIRKLFNSTSILIARELLRGCSKTSRLLLAVSLEFWTFFFCKWTQYSNKPINGPY